MKGANRTPAETPAGSEKVNLHPVHPLPVSPFFSEDVIFLFIRLFPLLCRRLCRRLCRCATRDEKLRDSTARPVSLAKIIARVASFSPTIIRLFLLWWAGEGGERLVLSLSTAKRRLGRLGSHSRFRPNNEAPRCPIGNDPCRKRKKKKKKKKEGESERVASFAIGRA